jgi:hypothetical protein
MPESADTRKVIEDIVFAANAQADLSDRTIDNHLKRIEQINLRQANDLIVGAAAVIASNPVS